jgi:hypothetical protein
MMLSLASCSFLRAARPLSSGAAATTLPSGSSHTAALPPCPPWVLQWLPPPLLSVPSPILPTLSSSPCSVPPGLRYDPRVVAFSQSSAMRGDLGVNSATCLLALSLLPAAQPLLQLRFFVHLLGRSPWTRCPEMTGTTALPTHWPPVPAVLGRPRLR